MQINIEELSRNEPLKCDICIVGAGAAGIELARFFYDKPLKVCLMEGGREHFDWKTQNLGHFTHNVKNIRDPANVVDISKPYDLENIEKSTSILRQYGGAMNIWAGNWKRLDPIDFVDKNIYDLSSWPIDYLELKKYYDELIEDYGLEHWVNSEREILDKSEATNKIIPTIALKDRSAGYLGSNNIDALRKSENIHLILGANATEILFSQDGSHVRSMLFKSTQQEEVSVEAKTFILACGTVENTRILLTTKEIIDNHSLIGRNLLSHPKGYPTIIIPKNQYLGVSNSNHNEIKLQIGFRLRDEVLLENELPNHYIILGECNAIDKSSGEKYDVLSVKFFLEQLPNINSRITLGEKKDVLGMPIPHLNFNFCKQDYELLCKYVKVFNSFLQKHELGKMLLTQELKNLEDFTYPSHFLGTTRMGKTKSEGVINSDSKVFGTENLYIAGGSIFPTVGSANPTFTILALAKRLAKHVYHRVL